MPVGESLDVADRLCVDSLNPKPSMRVNAFVVYVTFGFWSSVETAVGRGSLWKSRLFNSAQKSCRIMAVFRAFFAIRSAEHQSTRSCRFLS